MRKTYDSLYSPLCSILIILICLFACDKNNPGPVIPPVPDVTFPTGALPSDSLRLLDVPFVTMSDTAIFPAFTRVQSSTTWNIGVPPARKQAGGSCVGWAIGYGFMSYSFGVIEGNPNFSA